MAPIPISMAPKICLCSSRGSSQASSLKCPFVELPAKAPAQTPKTDPTPKLGLVPEAVIKKRIAEPIGAVKLWDTGANPKKPSRAIKCVLIHPPEIAMPTAIAQNTWFLFFQKGLLQKEIVKIAKPKQPPIAGTGRPDRKEI